MSVLVYKIKGGERGSRGHFGPLFPDPPPNLALFQGINNFDLAMT